MNYIQWTTNDPLSGLSRSFMPDFEMCPCMRVPRPTIDAYYPVRHIAPFFIRLEFTLAKDGFVASSGE